MKEFEDGFEDIDDWRGSAFDEDFDDSEDFDGFDDYIDDGFDPWGNPEHDD